MKTRSKILICAAASLCTAQLLCAAVVDQAEIFSQKCSKCHGAHAEGNPAKKGPALNDDSIGYLQMEMTDLQGDLTLTGETLSDHAKMEHSMKRLEELGYMVNPDEMAKYIYTHFNPEAKKR
jgi:cytochrome c553